MEIDFDYQNASTAGNIPALSLFRLWILSALEGRCSRAEISLRVVDPDEMAELNFRYRETNKPTNVLAFPLETSPYLVGDLVICAPVVALEAKEQNKEEISHWAHLTIHGALHLLGYDHETMSQADEMEELEVEILKKLGFQNPY